LSRKPIIWHSNAPEPLSATGYSNQTGLFVPRLAKAGYDVAISCMTSVSDHIGEWEGITCYPMGMTPYSTDTLRAHATDWFRGDPGLVVTLFDVWALGPESVMGFPTASWTPVHSRPMSVGDQRFFGLAGALPIAMSQHGAGMMRQAGLNPLYIPHGVDTSIFKPVTEDERALLRRRLNVPDGAFLIASVGANKGKSPSRKAWSEQLQAFAAFRADHAEAVLLIHSYANVGWGVDMRPIISDLGIADSVIFSDDYMQWTGRYPSQYIAAVQGCADVCLNPSMGEGFGLAILQAQACGTPVIVGQNSAQIELCGSGWTVPGQDWWYEDDAAWWQMPFTRDIVKALEKAYRQSKNAKQVAQARRMARDFALGYDVDKVFTDYWLPAMEMLEQYAGMSRVRPGAGVPLPTIESDGLNWLARGSHTDDWIAVSHEATLAPVLDGLMPEGGVFLDVGAHIGRWSLRLAGKASAVIAVEPNPDTAAVLRYHIDLNGLGGKITVIEAAAWDKPDRLYLHDPNKRLTGGSTRARPVAETEGATAVDAVPLSMLLMPDEDDAPLPRLDLVKLDVEGADLAALRGMAALLLAYKPVLFIEDHSIYGYYDRADLLALVESLGYDAELFLAALPAGREAPYVIARPKTDG
jgi:FkbM family methyltransferase